MTPRRTEPAQGATRARWRAALALALWACAGVALSLACDSGEKVAPARASASAKPRTPDRLAPGELAEGKDVLFGLKLPLGMKTDARFPHSGHASGTVSAEKLANYVRHRVQVARVELAASGTVFPQATIHGAEPERRFRIEVTSKGRNTKLAVHWLNPPKPPVVTGLSEEQRWQRAGISRDGKLIGQQELE